jgi:nitroreductase
MDFNKVIKKRASIRRYSDKKPKIEDVVKLIDAANLAPSPGNLPILQFIIVEDPEKIAQIAVACQQNWIKQAPFLVVFCSSFTKPNILYEERADKYIKQHAGAAVENFLLKATDMGLASCWVGAFSDVTIRNILKIPEDKANIEAILPIGYQHAYDKTTQRTKRGLGERLRFENFKNKFKSPFIKLPRGEF